MYSLKRRFSKLSGRIESIIEMLHSLYEDENRPILLPYLLAKRSDRFYKLDVPQSGRTENDILHGLVQQYTSKLVYCLDSHDVLEWDEEETDQYTFIKSFLANEHDFFSGLNSFTQVDKESYIKKRYPLRFFNIKIPLNRFQSIHIFQQIKAGYKAEVKIKMGLYEDRTPLRLIDNRDEFEIKSDFQFMCFVDIGSPNVSFSIIHRRKGYENLFDYFSRYREAYETIDSLPYINVGLLGDATRDTWRKCYSLLTFNRYQECLTIFSAELRNEESFSLDALRAKNINVRFDNGNPVITPINPKQLKDVCRILKDGLVRTHLLGRRGIVGRVDEV
jgi:hypothetical protein